MGSYFITGATGFLGRHVVPRILERADTDAVYVLVRSQSRHRLDELIARWPHPERVVPVTGDLTAPGLGVDLGELPARPNHVVHLGAIYDLTADDAANRAANVTGTENVISFAADAGARWLHHVSSIAVAGDYQGRFTEHDFDLGQRLPSPYHTTKFEAERLVREQDRMAWKVYRPAAVVGDSHTGEMDKVDGPYYFLPLISRLSRLPEGLPLVAPDLGSTNVVPVDYVADALVYLMHTGDPSGSTYHLVNPKPQRLTTVFNTFARAAGAPRVRVTTPSWISAGARRGMRALGRFAVSPPRTGGRHSGGNEHSTEGQHPTGDQHPTGNRRSRQQRQSVQAIRQVLGELGLPPEVLPHMELRPVFDTTVTQRALEGSGLRPPQLEEYADALYRYWARHLDAGRARNSDPRGALHGRKVMVTGASSGIGEASAREIAKRGAVVLLVARRTEELERLQNEITEAGGQASIYPCDLTESESVDALVKQVFIDHGAVDMLVNNAGRSIRRSVHLSVDRLHDYERTMALNYFAPVRLILGLLPHMRERRFGRIVNVSTMGTQSITPRFSAYLASKSALEMFGKVANNETLGDNVTFTSVHMPLVRTPMIEATSAYRAIPAASPKQAAKMVVKALIRHPESMTSPVGTALELSRMFAPRTTRTIAHLTYGTTAESAPEARERKKPLADFAGTVTRIIWQRL